MTIQRIVKQLGITGNHALSPGFDSYLQNGLRLFSKIEDTFFSAVRDTLQTDACHQKHRFNYNDFKKIYDAIANYETSYLSSDKQYLLAHDPTIQPIIQLKEHGIYDKALLSSPSIMRNDPGTVKPLERVKLHYKVPSIHFMKSQKKILEGRKALNEIINLFTKRMFMNVSISKNHRNIGHYADWSISAHTETLSSFSEVIAGYQLSKNFSKSLGSQNTFFEMAISSRFMARFIEYLHNRLSGNIIFPSIVSPTDCNIIFSPAKKDLALSIINQFPEFMFDCIPHKKGGTSHLQKAQELCRHNGAPLTLFLRIDENILQTNINRNREVVTDINARLIKEGINGSDIILRKLLITV